MIIIGFLGVFGCMWLVIILEKAVKVFVFFLMPSVRFDYDFRWK